MMKDIPTTAEGAPRGAPFIDIPENWDRIRAQYETTGISVPDLARKFGVSEQMLQYYIDTEGWQQNSKENLLRVVEKGGNEAFETVKEALKNKYVLAELLQDQRIQPKYHIVEAAVLNKAIEILANLNSELPTAGVQFLQTVKAVKALYEVAKPLKLGGKKDEDDELKDKKLVVNILNKA